MYAETGCMGLDAIIRFPPDYREKWHWFMVFDVFCMKRKPDSSGFNGD